MLHKGQHVRWAAGGYFVLAIMALFGNRAYPVMSYRDAARALLEEASEGKDHTP